MRQQKIEGGDEMAQKEYRSESRTRKDRTVRSEILTACITQNAALEVREVLSLIHLDAVN